MATIESLNAFGKVLAEACIVLGAIPALNFLLAVAGDIVAVELADEQVERVAQSVFSTTWGEIAPISKLCDEAIATNAVPHDGDTALVQAGQVLRSAIEHYSAGLR